MPGLAGLPEDEAGWYTATGGNHQPDSWSFRVHSRSIGTHSEPKRFLQAYLYAKSAGGLRLIEFPYGMSFTARHPETGATVAYDLDTWNEIEVRANTAAGRIELWVNGMPTVRLHDVVFTATGEAFVSQIIAETFYNGTPEQTHDIRFRNIRLIA
ncbi:MAG: hypothetical protein EA425_17335 [Puniceicoccaceae bacterium]|nr:MAG: hypothetical protein EA425_17335 [Puniceicoccaceae bacterium]